MIKRISFFIIAVCISFFSSSSPVITITSPDYHHQLGIGDYEILVDTSNKLTVYDVSGSQSRNFKLSSLPYNYNENNKATYWVRFFICNQTSVSKWMLEDLDQQSQNVEVFVPHNHGGFSSSLSGTARAFHHREYKVKNPSFDLPAERGKVYAIYIRVKSENHAGFTFNIRSQQYFTHKNTLEYFLLGLYYGVMLAMAIYNLVLYFKLREKVYLFYITYIASCILISSSEEGVGFQFLWDNHPGWNIFIDYYLAPISLMLTFVTYAVYFLELPYKFQSYLKLQLVVTVLYLIYFIAQVSFEWVPYYAWIYTLPFVCVYSIAVKVYFEGYKPARYFILGYTFTLISLVLIRMRFAGLIPSGVFAVYSYNYGFIVEVIVLSLALGDRFGLLKKERENAQAEVIRELKNKENLKNVLIKQLQEKETLKDHVNRELENKVSERTKDLNAKSLELEESNKKLQLAIEGLNKMNMELDLDNWGLKKKVSEATKMRILSEDVSYEEFLKIFPNDAACYRYLEEIKWGVAYQCRKCEHDKYNQPKTFARKCTRCGSIESVTASTLFHSLKFPINKAFYIVYQATGSKSKVTVEELSEILDLRKNTCWAFRKKVLERQEEMEKKRGKANIKWENLFLDQN